MIGRGNKQNDLYILDTASFLSHSLSGCAQSSDFPSSSISVNTVSASLWHTRLGHLSPKILAILQPRLSFSFPKCNQTDTCYICPLAKQKRLPFVCNNHMSPNPFDLLHCDIWGPFHIPSYSGHRFFLTLVDDCTRFTWVFLMKNKSDASFLVPRFFQMIHTQFNSKIKCFRSDNAKELAFTDFFNEQGVLHQFSCVETPQQNSVVERKHQHLLNVARALYFQSKIPIEFWTDCILTATFLINRIPSPLLNNQTPYEKLYHQQVDYSLFKVFGCLAFASTLTVNRTKFHPRAKPCVFIGYSHGMKGYKLYDLQTKHIFVSRNVFFHESTFPFSFSSAKFQFFTRYC